MVKIPKLKKKISSFLTKEDGKISKENLVKAGILLSAAALSSLSASADCPPDGSASHDDHCNDLSVNYSQPTVTGTHEHGHGSHSSHSAHSAHSSHSNHSSHGSHNSSGW